MTATLEGVLPPAAKVDSEAIKDALKETMPDGATVGRVEPSLLKRIVASIFG
ncbi:MAG: hypothetical protein IT381_22315 [Deltaproteobacteria bacterium]|nr:hypothetical protein [Deltaproteobacteria bacterium]